MQKQLGTTDLEEHQGVLGSNTLFPYKAHSGALEQVALSQPNLPPGVVVEVRGKELGRAVEGCKWNTNVRECEC